MKTKILFITLFITFSYCRAQETPEVHFASTTNVVGNCNYNSKVYTTYRIKKNNIVTDTTTIKFKDSTTVTIDNKFNIKFTHPREVGNIIYIYTRINNTQKYIVKNEQEIVNDLTEQSTKNESAYASEIVKINEFASEKYALRNTSLIYKSQILSTNFSIPLVRFNFTKGDDKKQGDILLFNSIGAGVGYYWGRLERTRDDRGEIVNEEFSNTLGFNVGAIFSAGTGEEDKNVFAPVFNFAVLDFQIGVGIELGTRVENQKREFVTLSYAIPLYKLSKKGYRIYGITPNPIESVRKSQN